MPSIHLNSFRARLSLGGECCRRNLRSSCWGVAFPLFDRRCGAGWTLLAGSVAAAFFTVGLDDRAHPVVAFGVGFDAASPYLWALAAVLLIGGFLVARKTWSWVGHAWDGAATLAREKGIAA